MTIEKEQTPAKSSASSGISRGKKLILIDGNAIIHRAYHALPPFTTKKGELVNAVYGFSSTLLSVISEFKPDYVVASFDLAGKTFRHEKFEQYKATRVKGDDELYAQIPRVKEVVKAFNIPIYEKAGYEADDIIGTIATQLKENHVNIETIIVTGDMDTLQLVNGSTKVYTMRRGLSDSHLYDEEKVFQRYGLSPAQIIDYKGLRGDPSDNIPGVKGIGEKTATDLLQKFETVEGVYEHIEQLKGAVKEKLERDKANAILSKELATIDCKAPIKFDLEKAHIHDYDREELVKLFSELNFYSLIKRLPQTDGVHPVKTSEAGLPTAEFNGVKDFKYFIFSKENAEEILGELKKTEDLSLAIQMEDKKLSGIGVSWKTGRSAFFAAENFSKIQPFLENTAIKKIGYDLKYVYKQLFAAGIHLENISFDVMLAAYVVNPGEKIELEKMIFSELGEDAKFEQKGKRQLSLVASNDEIENAVKIVCQKADYALKLKKVLEKTMEKISSEQKKANNTKGTISTIFSQMEMPLLKILADMEITGIELNSVIFEGISKKITVTIKNLEKAIYEMAGREFNINSPSQLGEVLFVDLQLPTFDIKKNKTGYSTGAAELEKLRREHKIIEKIEEYRELFKLKTTYLDTIPLLCDDKSRIHTTFNQAVAATGRLSSTDPNLQNIPIKSELSQLIRTAFVAGAGKKLISADYSQIDLRCVAHVSGDKKMIEAFHRGDDIHTLTAAEVNGVTHSQVTQKMRSSAKALNFGIIYGMGAFSFSVSAKIPMDQAKKFISAYMEKFSGVAKYMKNTREFAKKHGWVETIMGRRRNLNEIHSPNFQVAAAAERMAINMPIQGLAADIVKLAMIKTQEAFANDPEVKMLLQIHDEIILEVTNEKAEKVAQKLKEIMENVYPLSVPLVVDVCSGDNWGEI